MDHNPNRVFVASVVLRRSNHSSGYCLFRKHQLSVIISRNVAEYVFNLSLVTSEGKVNLRAKSTNNHSMPVV